MIQYLTLMEKIIVEGEHRTDRTGTGTLSIFGHQMRFNLEEGFPLVTTKKVHFKSVVHELLWFLSGDTNVTYLQKNNVRIWNEWANEKGDLGRIYGAQWRSWRTPDGRSIDQIENALTSLKTNPHSRRHLVVAYNPGELDQMALPPCHAFFQFYVSQGRVSCQLYQRSADVFLGVPFNIASYALLTTMFAHELNLRPGEFIHTLGDAHLYTNHLEQAHTQLARTPKQLPRLKLNPEIRRVFDFTYEDITIENYTHHPCISAEVSV